jgi:hypothetical protein
VNVTHVVGVDPGIVHTGVVRLLFVPKDHAVWVDHSAIVGPDAKAASSWILGDTTCLTVTPHIFVEGYKPRSHYDSDARMTAAVQEMKRELHGTVLLNTGVKKVVKQPLMELLGCWKFSTVTHHQDLRSAARIALLGMLKSEHLNRVVTTVVTDHLEGRTWNVCH